MKAVCLIFNKIQVGHRKIIPTDRPFMSSLESALCFCSPVHSLTNPSFSQISACLRYHPVNIFPSTEIIFMTEDNQNTNDTDF